MAYRVAELISDCLLAQGVERAFQVPGESFLPLLDALYDRAQIDLVTCRHEGSATLAAIADAKLTGKPGIALVSRGPGVCNAAIGLHVAAQEDVPLIVLMGQVDTPNLGRGAVQEIDTGRSFSDLVKWSARVDRTDTAAEVIARAFAVATHGTPGPVIVELPENVLSEPAARLSRGCADFPRPAVTSAQLDRTAELIGAAQRPILIIGNQDRSTTFRQELAHFVESTGIPVATTNKNQDQFSNHDPLWIGHLGIFISPAQQRLFEEADLLLVVGTRLNELTSLGYAFPRQGADRQKLIHAYPDPEAIGLHFATDLAIVSEAMPVISGLRERGIRCRLAEDWLAKVSATRGAVHGWNTEKVPEADVLGHALTAIARHLSRDAIITTDSGNFAAWVHRIFLLSPAHRLLGSECGAMGTGVPSGLAACLRYPERQVIAFCGDGGFLMNGNELATAVARNLSLKIVISNNRSYGTIRSYQERAYPKRVSGTDLVNPDFSALARAFGANAFTVQSSADALAAVAEAMATEGPAVIEIRCNPEQTLERTMQAMM